MRSVKHGRKRGKKVQIRKKTVVQKKKQSLKKKQKSNTDKLVNFNYSNQVEILAKFCRESGIQKRQLNRIFVQLV